MTVTRLIGAAELVNIQA